MKVLNLWTPELEVVVNPIVLIPVWKSFVELYNLIVFEFTNSAIYFVFSTKNLFWSAFDPAKVPIPNAGLPFVLYTTSSPLAKLWSPKNVIVSADSPIPPPNVNNLASKLADMNLSSTTGCRATPLPGPPPVILTETTLSNSLVWGSTKIFSTDPLITGLTSAVVPDPVLATSMTGGFITSYPVPEFTTVIELKGPE